MRDLFEDQIAIIEDRITVFMLSRRAYCHIEQSYRNKLLLCLCSKRNVDLFMLFLIVTQSDDVVRKIVI